MLTSSAKAKGRRLQQYVRDEIIKTFGLSQNDVRSTSMGTGGVDIQLSELAQSKFPYAIECKAHEGYGKLYGAMKQAVANSGETTALLVIRSNKQKPLVVMNFENFMRLHGN